MLIEVFLKPNAKKESIIKINENIYRIQVKQPAHQNQANEASLLVLAKHLEIAVSKIKLIRGKKSHHKFFKIF